MEICISENIKRLRKEFNKMVWWGLSQKSLNDFWEALFVCPRCCKEIVELSLDILPLFMQMTTAKGVCSVFICAYFFLARRYWILYSIPVRREELCHEIKLKYAVLILLNCRFWRTKKCDNYSKSCKKVIYLQEKS